MRGSRIAALGTAFLLLGCTERGPENPLVAESPRTPAVLVQPTRSASRSAAPSSIPAPSAAPTSPPDAEVEPDLAGKSIALEVPDFAPALVRFPTRRDQAPVLVVTHGAGGTTEAHCDLWQRITQESAILLCVRGRARSPVPADGEYYPDHHALERETFAALAALRERFSTHIADGPVYYVGFSQGATMGALMLVEHANEVTRLALVEGGFADWNIPRAHDFRARGGERVLFVCGRKECAEPAQNAVEWFTHAGVSARLEYLPGAGHTHDGPVEARVAALFPWLIEGDARFHPALARP